MNGAWARALQTRARRRWVVAGYLLTAAALFALLALVGIPRLEIALAAGAFRPMDFAFAAAIVLAGLAANVVEQALYMALRPVIALRGEPFDERQAALVASANGLARFAGLLGVAAVAAIAIAGASAPLLLLTAAFAAIGVFMTPHFVLAWTLPDMDYNVDEGLDD